MYFYYSCCKRCSVIQSEDIIRGVCVWLRVYVCARSEHVLDDTYAFF